MRGVTARAHRSRIPEFTALARTLSRFRAPVHATLDGGPSRQIRQGTLFWGV
jgi:hypothetical protein